MSRKRVQLSDLDHKKICQPAVEHISLSPDKLTALLQTQLSKPQFSAQDEMLLQMLATKMSKMTVSRITQSRQQH